MAGIPFEVVEKFGVLSESPQGWTKELRLVSWNNRGARYDLREWSPGDDKASRGITLSLREMYTLQEMLGAMELPEDEEGEEGEEAADKADKAAAEKIKALETGRRKGA